MFRSPFSRRKSAKHKTFGEPLDSLPLAEGTELPLCAYVLIEHLRQHGLGLEGLFRVNGNQNVMHSLIEQMDKGNMDLTGFDIPAVASTFKKFLRELPAPLIPVKVQKQLLAVHRAKGSPERIHNLTGFADYRKLLHLLPPRNFALLSYTVEFLNLVSHHKEQTKMTPANLAIVISPNIFWVPNEKLEEVMASLENNAHSNALLALFIANYRSVFKPVPVLGSNGTERHGMVIPFDLALALDDARGVEDWDVTETDSDPPERPPTPPNRSPVAKPRLIDVRGYEGDESKTHTPEPTLDPPAAHHSAGSSRSNAAGDELQTPSISVHVRKRPATDTAELPLEPMTAAAEPRSASPAAQLSMSGRHSPSTMGRTPPTAVIAQTVKSFLWEPENIALFKKPRLEKPRPAARPKSMPADGIKSDFATAETALPLSHTLGGPLPRGHAERQVEGHGTAKPAATAAPVQNGNQEGEDEEDFDDMPPLRPIQANAEIGRKQTHADAQDQLLPSLDHSQAPSLHMTADRPRAPSRRLPSRQHPPPAESGNGHGFGFDSEPTVAAEAKHGQQHLEEPVPPPRTKHHSSQRDEKHAPPADEPPATRSNSQTNQVPMNGARSEIRPQTKVATDQKPPQGPNRSSSNMTHGPASSQPESDHAVVHSGPSSSVHAGRAESQQQQKQPPKRPMPPQQRAQPQQPSGAELDAIQQELDTLKRVIHQFQTEFKAQHNRKPQHEEKAPIRTELQQYKRLKQQLQEAQGLAQAVIMDQQPAAANAAEPFQSSHSVMQPHQQKPVAEARAQNARAGRPTTAATSPREAMEAKLAAWRAENGVPEDIESLSESQAKQQKSFLKRLLAEFDRDFAAKHGRAPEHADKAVVSSLYNLYGKLKKRMATNPQEHPPATATAKATAPARNHSSSVVAATTGVAGAPAGAGTPAGAEAPSHVVVKQTIPAPLANGRHTPKSPPAGLHASKPRSPAGQQSVSPSSGAEHALASTTAAAFGNDAEQIARMKLMKEFAATKAAKKDLQKRLHQFEAEFAAAHGRPVQNKSDRLPLQSEYLLYKELKRKLQQLETELGHPALSQTL